jgi:membrane-bound lytic murein transglycosylase D
MSLSVTSAAQEPAKPAEEETPSLDQLYETGKSLFDQFAPAEIKEQYEFPSKEQWDQFAARLQHALENDNLAELAQYLPEARAALPALRALPGGEEYADWLQERIDYIEAAAEVSSAPSQPAPAPPPEPGEIVVKAPAVPYYDLWVRRVQARPLPPLAGKYLPDVRAAFEAEGLPPEIAWVAEVESTFNPGARSPAGAKGLFQMMPETARSLGLKTFLPDERTDAIKSAHAAARYLRALHGKFGTWPLAFAAYNAGEGRVRRLLKQRDGTTFASIASALPSETRMYVPKVCATIAVRTGVPPEKLPSPAG